MSYNSAFEAEMRKYQLDKVTSNVACSLTPRQLHTPIEQIDNVQKLNRRRTDSAKKKKTPLFLRRWFLGLLIMTFSALYFVQAGYVRSVKNINENVKSATGIDILSADTYKKLAKPPEENASPVKTLSFTEQVEENAKNNAQNTHHTRDYSVNTEALGSDMSHIQREAERLDAMAREFDEQFRK